MKVAFESVLDILTLVAVRFLAHSRYSHPLMGSNYQEDTTEESLFVGLAKLCSRACLVLDAVTRGEADGLGELSHKSKIPKGVFISLIFPANELYQNCARH